MESRRAAHKLDIGRKSDSSVWGHSGMIPVGRYGTLVWGHSGTPVLEPLSTPVVGPGYMTGGEHCQGLSDVGELS